MRPGTSHGRGAKTMSAPVATLLLPGFDYQRIDVDGTMINCAVRGSGSPLLLLHGYPQNHLMWRHVAPALAEDYTVVAADLRGYGDSGKPAPDPVRLVYSKRFMARDQVGHVTRAMATAYYHWFFLTTPNGLPEHLIGADPGYWVRSLIGPLLGEGASIEPPVMADYIRCFADPATIAGSCADYRAAASTDLVHDEESFAAGQRIGCPVLVLWGTQAFVGRGCEPLTVWRQYAPDVRGRTLPTGHFLPEEAPDLVLSALRDFLD